MDNERYQGDLKELKSRMRRRDHLIGFLLLLVLIASMTIYRLIGAERTVVTPPAISKTFWVSGEKVGNAYLEQMGGYVAWLILDVTPASIEWKKDALLTFVAPEHYGALKIRQEVEAERLRRLNASTYFLLQQLEPDEEKQSVVLTGLLRTTVNGQETRPVQCRYLAGFSFKGGRTHLSMFKEINDEKQGTSLCGGHAGR